MPMMTRRLALAAGSTRLLRPRGRPCMPDRLTERLNRALVAEKVARDASVFYSELVFAGRVTDEAEKRFDCVRTAAADDAYFAPVLEDMRADARDAREHSECFYA